MLKAVALSVAPFAALTAAILAFGRPEAIVVSRCSGHNWIWRFALRENEMSETLEKHLADRSYTAANVFPLYPFMELVMPPVFGEFWVGPCVMNFVLTVVNNALFYRLCLAMAIPKPLLMTAIFTMFPPRAILLRYVANEYNLVAALISLVFIAKRRFSYVLLLVSVYLLIITSELGLVISVFLVLETLVTGKVKAFVACAAGGAAGLATLMAFHEAWLGSSTAYFDEAIATRRYPFVQLFKEAKTISTLRQFHGAYGFYIAPVICGLALMKTHTDMALSLLMALVWSSTRSGPSAFDVACPLVPFLVIFGAQRLLTSHKFAKAMYIIAPVYALAYLWMTCEQIQYL